MGAERFEGALIAALDVEPLEDRRLLSVSKNGTRVEEYQYNGAGTRTYEMNAQKGIAGRILSYDDEDHLEGNILSDND